VLLGLIVCSTTFAGFARGVWSAEATRFLVSYGGTAGYQLPLWVNKELGFSKKYGVDLEIILIQAGSPNIQALLGGSLQLTQTAASSAVIGASRGAPTRATLSTAAWCVRSKPGASSKNSTATSKNSTGRLMRIRDLTAKNAKYA